MNKNLLTLLMLCFSVTLLAEDVIITNDNQEIKAIIVEIGVDVVKYRRADDAGGTIYSMPQNKISTIHYENGTIKTFRPSSLTIEGRNIYQDGSLLSKEEYRSLLQNNCPLAYEQYQKGLIWKSSGSGVLVAGALFIAIPAISSMLSGNYDKSTYKTYLYTLGGLSCAVSIPMICVGATKMKKKSVNLYNENCAPDITYNITTSENGIGLAINF